MHLFRCYVLLLLFVLTQIAGCASVSLVDSRRMPDVPVNRYQSVLVVGVAENRQMRQVFEEVLSGELRKQGITATPSYTITGPEEPLSRALVEKAARTVKADAVLATRVVDMKRETKQDVGYTMTSKTVGSFFDYYGNAGMAAVATYDMKPVDVTLSKTVCLESNFFDVSTTSLVWTGRTDAVDPKGIVKSSEEFAKVVIKALNKEGLIP